MEERTPSDRYISFTHLGVGEHIIRIYTLSGDLIKKIEQTNSTENDAGNIVRWDLRNQFGIPIASGMYIVHITTPYGEKILKVAVLMPEERIDVY